MGIILFNSHIEYDEHLQWLDSRFRPLMGIILFNTLC